MRRISRNIPIALMLALGCAATAGAENPEAPTYPHERPLFKKLDADGNGFVTRAEAKRLKGFEAAFTEADENRDGKLSPDEFVKAESIYSRSQAGGYLEDSMITAKVKAALLKDMPASAGAVSVETFHGRVLLSGFVEDERDVKRARELAAAVRGVSKVSSGLQVK
jgi:hyperosmotically inducible protein